MDKFLLALFWIYSILGTILITHDFAYESGKKFERENQGYRFDKTKRAFVENRK